MKILIRGAGDIATGIALRLYRAGMQVVMTDLPAPTAIRRTVCFSQAIILGEMTVEDVTARRAETPDRAEALLAQGLIPVLADPDCTCRTRLRPDALVDAILAKRNLGTKMDDAPIVVGIGPGFTAGEDCHAVVETMRGHTLGRVIYRGSALPNTNIPGLIGGYAGERRRRRRGGGPAHEMHHLRRTAGHSGRWNAGFPRYEGRRRGPPVQAGVLHHRLGQGPGGRRRRAGGSAAPASSAPQNRKIMVILQKLSRTRGCGSFCPNARHFVPGQG